MSQSSDPLITVRDTEHLIEDLRDSLESLIDDLTDAEEDRNPETGKEYQSVHHGRLILIAAQQQQDLISQRLTALANRCIHLEHVLHIATGYIRYCYEQLPEGEDRQELEDLNTCRRALQLEPIPNPYQGTAEENADDVHIP